MSFKNWQNRQTRSGKSTGDGRRRKQACRVKPCYAAEALEKRTLLSGIFSGVATSLDDQANGLVTAVQTNVSNALNAAQTLPVVGKQLGDFGAVQALTKLRQQLTTALNSIPDVAATAPTPATDDIIRNAFFSNLGTQGISLAPIGSIGQRGEAGNGPNQVSVTHPGGGLAVEMHLRLVTTQSSLTFNTGTDLPFTVAASITPSVTFDYEFAFQYNGQTSLISNAKLNDFDQFITTTNPSHALAVTASANPTFQGVVATIGLIQGKISANSDTGLTATFSLDNLGSSPSIALSGSAKLDLHLTGGLSGADVNTFPSISTDFLLNWTFPNNAPTATFNNVTVDMGTFLSGIVEPVLHGIQVATAPIKPVLDLVTTEIPGISDLSRFLGRGSVTLLSLASNLAGEAGYGPLADLVENIAHVIEVADTIDISNGELLMNLGNFSVASNTLEGSQVTAGQPNNPLAIVAAQLSSSGPTGAVLGTLSSDASDFINKLTQPSATASLDFPIFDDPIHGAFQLLLGQDADLVRFDAVVNDLTFDSNQLDSLSVAGFGLQFTGNLTLNAHLGIAYDTHGLIELINYLSSNPPSIDPGVIASDISDGLYVDAGTGINGSKIELSGSIGAAIGFNFGIFSLGVGGSIHTGNNGNDPIGITLKDEDGPGKLRFSNIGACAVVPNGELDAGISANLKVGVTILGHFFGYSQDFGLGSVTLLNLGNINTYNCHNIPHPVQVLAKLDTYVPGQLDLLLGTRAGERRVQDYLANNIAGTQTNGNENYTVTHLWDDDNGDGETVAVRAFGVTQIISGVKSIYGQSDAGNLTVNIEPGVEAMATVKGGQGIANLTYSGSGDCDLTAGNGDFIPSHGSTLIGGLGTSRLNGGPADDKLVPGSGPNYVYGNGGSNTIILQLPDSNQNHLFGGYSNGTTDYNADDDLEVLSLPLSDTLSLLPNGPTSFQVTYQAPGQSRTTVATAGSFTSVVLGGAGGTHIVVGDLSGTSLQSIALGVTPDKVPPLGNLAKFPVLYSQTAVSILNHGGSTTLGNPITGQHAINVFDTFSPAPLTEVDFLLGNTITIYGSSESDHFVQDKETVSVGNTVTRVDVDYNVALQPDGEMYSLHTLTVQVANVGSEDLLTLNGNGSLQTDAAGHVTPDSFDVTPDQTDRFAVEADNGGTNASLVVHGENEGIGSADISDIAANQLINRVVFSWTRYDVLVGGIVTLSNQVFFDDSIYSVVVNGPNQIAGLPGEVFRANRSTGATQIVNIGNHANDVIDVSGGSIYTLDGGDGADTYIVRWGPEHDSATIQENGIFDSDTLEVDDSSHVGLYLPTYSVMAASVTRTDHFPIVSGGTTFYVGEDNSINFTNMAKVTLDTGHGTSIPNQVTLYAMYPYTDSTVNTQDGVNYVDVVATAPATTTTVNTALGSNFVTLESSANRSTADINTGAGSNTVVVNGTGADSTTAITAGDGPSSIDVKATGPGSYNTITTGIGASSVNVDATGAGSTTTINTGIGHADVLITGAGKNLNAIAGALTVSGTGHASLRIDDKQGTAVLPTLPAGATNIQSSFSYSVTGQDVRRTVSYGYSVPNGGGSGIVVIDVLFNGIASLELDGTNLGAAYNVAATLASTPVTVNTGNGANAVSVSSPNNLLRTIASPLTVNGGAAGTTTLTLNDQANGPYFVNTIFGIATITTFPTYLVTSQGVTRTDSGTETFISSGHMVPHTATQTVNYSHLSGLVLNGGTTGNVFNVKSTSSGMPVTINAGSGVNTVNVGDASTPLDAVNTLTIHGGAGTMLTLDDEASASTTVPAFEYGSGVFETLHVSPRYQINASYLTRLNTVTDTVASATQVLSQSSSQYLTSVAFDNLVGLTIRGGSGQNTFIVGAATAAAPVTITAGNANDSVTVGDPGQMLQGINSLTVHGGTGTTLTLHDQANQPVSISAAQLFGDYARTTNPIYQISDHDVVRTDEVIETDPTTLAVFSDTLYHTAINYDHVAALTLNGGLSADTFRVLSCAAGTAMTIAAALGDAVTVGDAILGLSAIHGAINVNGQTNTTLTVDDHARTTADVVHVTPTTVGAAAGDAFFGPGGSLTYNAVASLTLKTSNASIGDSISVTPSVTTAFTINAGSPVPPTVSGDTLTIAGVGVTNPVLTPNGTGAGQYTFSNRKAVTYTGVEQTSIDSIAPVVLSINRSSPAGPNIASGVVTSVTYAVTFSEAVSGVTAAEFALALGSGVTASTPVLVSGSGASYTVTINNISGASTLGLNLLSDGAIKDLVGNPIPSGTGFTGQLYTVTATAPVVAAFTMPAAVEGTATAPVNGSFTGQAGDSFTATVDYGDGSGVQPLAIATAANSFTLGHAYAEEGSYTVTVVVSDTTLSLASAPAAATVTISAVAVQATITGAPATLTLGGSVNLTFSATNPNPLEMGPLIETWTITDSSSNVVASGTGSSTTFTPAAAGTYTVTFSAGESSTPDAETGTATTTITVNPVAPALTSVVLDDGLNIRQRSMIRSVTYNFTQPVQAPTAGSVTITQTQNLVSTGTGNTLTTGLNNDFSSALDFAHAVSSNGGATWTVPFLKSVAGKTQASGSLVDGVYSVTMHASLIKDASNQAVTSGDHVSTFHVLFGDINGTPTTGHFKLTNSDFQKFSATFNLTVGQTGYVPYFHFSGNFSTAAASKISNGDFGQFSNRFSFAGFVYTAGL